MLLLSPRRLRERGFALLTQPWRRLSRGNGAKGRRWYDWALAATDREEISLLIRRSAARPAELAFYPCYTPARSRWASW